MAKKGGSLDYALPAHILNRLAKAEAHTKDETEALGQMVTDIGKEAFGVAETSRRLDEAIYKNKEHLKSLWDESFKHREGMGVWSDPKVWEQFAEKEAEFQEEYNDFIEINTPESRREAEKMLKEQGVRSAGVQSFKTEMEDTLDNYSQDLFSEAVFAMDVNGVPRHARDANIITQMNYQKDVEFKWDKETGQMKFEIPHHEYIALTDEIKELEQIENPTDLQKERLEAAKEEISSVPKEDYVTASELQRIKKKFMKADDAMLQYETAADAAQKVGRSNDPDVYSWDDAKQDFFNMNMEIVTKDNIQSLLYDNFSGKGAFIKIIEDHPEFEEMDALAKEMQDKPIKINPDGSAANSSTQMKKFAKDGVITFEELKQLNMDKDKQIIMAEMLRTDENGALVNYDIAKHYIVEIMTKLQQKKFEQGQNQFNPKYAYKSGKAGGNFGSN